MKCIDRVAPVRAAVMAFLACCVVLSPARAGMFDDEEARKAIVDLRSRVAAVDDAAKARHAETVAANAQLSQLVQTLQRSILDLNGQIEALRGDLAKLRGTDEQLAKDLADAQRRQKDLAQAMDDRLRKLEPIKVAVDGSEFMALPEEKRQFEESLGRLRAGEFDKAVGALGQFQRRYPASGYGDAARYWLGNALYGKGDHKEAVLAFRAFVTAAPDHPRAPEALLALANSQVESKDGKGARKTIDELMKTYPKSEAAQAGKERLATIK